MKKIFGLLILGALTLTGCSSYGEFNDWTSDCLAAGGQVSRTHVGFWADRYECFVDGEIVTLPGWEGQ